MRSFPLVMAQRYFEGLSHAALYAKFRTSPPPALVNTVLQYLTEKYKGSLDQAVDVGCGSGQNTTLLAPHFTKVTGTDISPAQITLAQETKAVTNVTYLVSPAETIPFQSGTVQLVTACQACHWFDLPKFFTDVDRVLVPSGVVAVYGYLFPKLVNANPDKVLRFEAAIDKIYNGHTAGCWGPGRIDLDNRYADIHIPYKDRVRTSVLFPTKIVNLQDFTSYLKTWSGIETYKNKYGEEKTAEILREFQETVQAIFESQAPPEGIALEITYDCFLLMGRKPE